MAGHVDSNKLGQHGNKDGITVAPELQLGDSSQHSDSLDCAMPGEGITKSSEIGLTEKDLSDKGDKQEIPDDQTA